jgi:asparagine synthase (glutamine-hydrolysing)
MCGIAGWLNTTSRLRVDISSKESAIGVIAGILDRQHHRGPDARGLWVSANHDVVFGHNRLSILELSEAGAQPMVDSDSDWVITYNGELYNYKKLRQILETKHLVQFKGNSDTEVFLYGVKVWGIDEFLRRADGMFAAGLYSARTGRLLLVRDRVGEKPLYYTLQSDGLYFASELRPLVRSLGREPPLDPSGLATYLMMRYVPAPLTIYEGFYKLKPGHFLVVEPGRAPREYAHFSWDPHASEIPEHPKTFEQVVQVTEKVLTQSLEARLMSDVPLGFFLSGGVDSTLTAALVRKHFGTQINTYTIGFEGDPKSEHPVSERTAKLIGANHKTHIFKPQDIGDVSRELIASMDEPNGDRSCVPTYLLCKHARSEVTVALGGDGGDELFGGYQRYPGLNQQIGENLYPRAVDGLRWYLTHRLPVFTPNQVREICGPLASSAEHVLEDLAVHLYSPTRPEMDIRYVDFKSYLPGAVLSKVDRMSMQVSLEVRTPFFSEAVLELASRLPHGFLYSGQFMKPVLREICNRLGLSHVAKLEKRGFGMPPEFLAQDQNALTTRATAALKVIQGHVAGKANMKAWAEHTPKNMNALWATIVLGEWLGAEA